MSDGILTLTTDFGADGPYVAAMKGIVLGLAPRTRFVDVSHAIEPQNISEGGFVLASIVPYFPSGTVHLAVVDPGVGTDRRIVAAEVDGQWFVLPDNGLIGPVVKDRRPSGIWAITNPSLRRSVVSSTFHGRDIMAPAAAHLLKGGDPGELGPPVDRMVLPTVSEPIEEGAGWLGEVVFRDSFGNLITNLSTEHLGPSSTSLWEVELLGRTIERISRTYGESPAGSLVALVGSSGRLEIAIVNDSAGRWLAAGRGTSVRIRRRQENVS